MPNYNLPTIAHDEVAPHGTIVLEWYLTPSFCRQQLSELKKFHKAKKEGADTGKTAAGHIRNQIKRYTAFAIAQDWDTDRNAPLVWRRPAGPTEVSIYDLVKYPDWRITLGEHLVLIPPGKVKKQ